jgi:hypothetical protein
VTPSPRYRDDHLDAFKLKLFEQMATAMGLIR